MADKFICPEGHTNPKYQGQDDGRTLGPCWWECDEHPGRVLAGYFDPPVCPGHVCGHPESDHPTTAERYTNRVEGKAIWHHAHEGEGGPCQEPVTMHKCVGFLCIECGAPLVGMPTKATPEEAAEVLARSSPSVEG